MAKKTKEKKRERTERRFVPQSTTPPLLVRVTGAVGALGLGAGLMGQYGRPEPVPYASWILAGGALIAGSALWIGTSADPALRIGDAGIAIEKGGARRLPWWGIESITWDAELKTLTVNGKEDAGGTLSLRLALRSQPQAVAWIVKEASARIPKSVSISDEARESIPKASRDAGEVIKLEPPQVVGKHCSESGRFYRLRARRAHVPQMRARVPQGSRARRVRVRRVALRGEKESRRGGGGVIDLRGQRALVTGASRGIGAACVCSRIWAPGWWCISRPTQAPHAPWPTKPRRRASARCRSVRTCRDGTRVSVSWRRRRRRSVLWTSWSSTTGSGKRPRSTR